MKIEKIIISWPQTDSTVPNTTVAASKDEEEKSDFSFSFSFSSSFFSLPERQPGRCIVVLPPSG